MFFYEGFSCPVCGKPFTHDDDIVACPKCGAAHHRECWKSVGHCAYADDHDTPNQWSREKARQAAAEKQEEPPTKADTTWTCPHCGVKNLEFAEFCTHCGKERDDAPEWQSPEPAHTAQQRATGYSEYSPYRVYTPIRDPFGEVGPDEVIEDTPAKDVAAYVGPNGHYYLPRFKNIASGNPFSWNWAAFLFGPYWLLYRKNFLSGFITLALFVISQIVTNIISLQMLNMAGPVSNYAELIDIWQDLIASNDFFRYLMIGMGLLSMIELTIRLFLGIFGNWLYQKHAFSSIRKLREEAPDRYPAELPLIGGISLAYGMLSYLLSNYLLQFLFMLF